MRITPKVKAAGLAVICLIIVGGIVLFALLTGGGSSEAGGGAGFNGTGAGSNTAQAADDASTEIPFNLDAKKAFEEAMTFDVDNFSVDAYLAKNFGGKFQKDNKGNYMIPFSWNSMPKKTRARTRSSVRKGLRKHRISDAAEFCYNRLTAGDVKRVLQAKLGDTIAVRNIKALAKEYKLALLQNPVLFEGFVKLVKGLHYEDSRSFGELNPWVGKFLREYRSARRRGKGTNHWLFAYRNRPKKGYVTKTYYSYVTYFLAGYVDACEVNVEALKSRVNYHLPPGQQASQVKLTRCTHQESLPVLTFSYVYKDNVLTKIGSNICDKRPETLAKVHAKKRTYRTPTGTPIPQNPGTPTVNRRPGNPTVHTRPGDPTVKERPKKSPRPKKPAPTKVPGNPKAEPVDTPKPGDPAPDKVKDPAERPEERPKDDKGPGEYEPTPKVPKSDSEDVSESQHQPVADKQGGGQSDPKEEVEKDPSAHQSEGGQTVTDPHKDGERTENERASTDEIPKRDSDTGGKEGDKNGAYTPPD